MYKRTIGLTRERAARTRLVRFAREAGAWVPWERATVKAFVLGSPRSFNQGASGRCPHMIDAEARLHSKVPRIEEP